MKLIRYGSPGSELPGIISKGKAMALPGFNENFDEAFFENDGIKRLSEYVLKMDGKLPELPKGTRMGSPIARPSKIICIGMNYASHAKEADLPVPEEPIIFFKSTTALSGPDDDVIIPKGSSKLDWEIELAIVIGKKASYISKTAAQDYIAGYCVHNDYSERSFQLERGGQWVKGKSCDSFAPLGPYLVTPDEIPDVSKLRLWLTVNGKMMQDGNTSDLIFDIPFLVHYTSQFMTLLPGDIISTGTPGGVGLGIKPNPVYLKPGDEVVCGIDLLGSSSQRIKSFNSQ